MQETFGEAGFLSRRAKRGIHKVRAANRAWFELAYDLNTVLMTIATRAMVKAALDARRAMCGRVP